MINVLSNYMNEVGKQIIADVETDKDGEDAMVTGYKLGDVSCTVEAMEDGGVEVGGRFTAEVDIDKLMYIDGQWQRVGDDKRVLGYIYAYAVAADGTYSELSLAPAA